MNCKELESIELPFNLKILRKNTFYGCVKLKEIKTGVCLTEIENELIGKIENTVFIHIYTYNNTIKINGTTKIKIKDLDDNKNHIIYDYKRR